MPIQPNPLVKYLYDAQDIVPQPGTTLTPDEDFWQNPVTPVAASNFRLLPYQPDPEELPAATLVTPFGFGSGDGSFSTASFISGPTRAQVRYQFDPQDPGGSALVQTFFPDEDFWVNPVAPVIPEPTILWLADEAALNNNFDEDFWISGVNPVLWPNVYLAQWNFETDEFVPPPVFAQVADEEFWQNSVPPSLWPTVPPNIALSQLEVTQDIGQLFGQDDEDFWTNMVAPVAASFWLQPGYPAFDDQLVIAPQVPSDDNEFWQNPVMPIAAAMFIRFPVGAGTDDDLVVLQPTIAPTGQGTYLIYGLQNFNRHLTHV